MQHNVKILFNTPIPFVFSTLCCYDLSIISTYIDTKNRQKKKKTLKIFKCLRNLPNNLLTIHT